jgi:hypothetical protein
MEKVKLVIKYLQYGGEAIKTISKALDVIATDWPKWPNSVVDVQKKTNGNERANNSTTDNNQQGNG